MNQKTSERTIQLVGEENYKLIQNNKISLIGLGGVGGTCFEALIRSGFKNITICDFDVVSFSNLNRQILYTLKDINKLKVDVCINKSLKFCENSNELNINKINLKVDSNTNLDFLKDSDYVIDAIDNLAGKINIITYCLKNNIKVISCLGMGNRLDPSKVIITKLSKTSNDPLAKKLRSELRKININLNKVLVCFSNELPIKNKLNIVSSMVFVPSSAGLNIVSYIVKDIISSEVTKYEKN